jgi:gliding motility-associated-like protein
VTYKWNDNTTSEVKLTTSGIYRIQAKNANGCRKDFVVTVREEDCENAAIYMPNAFTPNGDGKNDVFRIPFEVRIDLKEFAIYNRWGNTVFRTTDRNTGWDGTLNGKSCTYGTYVYFIRGLINNKESLLKGTISLIR